MNWHIIYKRIATSLYELYKVHEESTGELIYQKFIGNQEFMENNSWFDNFIKDSNTNSVDPIHIFSSFNGSTLNSETREKRIAIILDILEIKVAAKKIVFEGCPTPTVINLLSVRNKNDQKEIWETFYSVTTNPDYLSEEYFKRIKNWYGVALASFTIFLFWIDSNNFLPLDSNTVGFLLATKKIKNTPTQYKHYKHLLALRKRISFRELVLVSYLFIHKGQKEIKYTKQFSKFLTLEGLSVVGAENFKLIAIRVKRSIKNGSLFSADKYYSFYDCFDVSDDESVRYIPDLDIEIYNNGQQNINISAIVGKNGSGKSTLMEFLFIAINNLSKKCSDIVDTSNFQLVKGVHLEFLIMTNFLFKVEINKLDVRVYRYDYDGTRYINPELFDLNVFLQEHFFYTIAVNYSHYALNSKNIGGWIKKLFHKNDSYQTPLVINPKRSAGNIDINVENALAKSRLISMILLPLNIESNNPLLNSFRNLTNDGSNFKIAKRLHLELNAYKLKSVRPNLTTGGFSFTRIENDTQGLLKSIYTRFNIPSNYLSSNDFKVNYSNEYILKKVRQITDTYKQYKFYIENGNYSDVGKLVEDLFNDQSHITFKLKQAINFLRFDHLKELKHNETYIYDTDELSIRIEDVRKQNKNIKAVELIPPSFFDTKIELEHTIDSTKSNFEGLSSGEKQRIYSISSLVYHLLNLDSVSQKDGVLVYNRINVVFDEIELYYHPEFQRKFIDDILKALEILKQYLERITDINFCFITHSPFILSDIPKTNVLFLDVDANEKPETFASNIHELLATSFFLKDGYMGQLAKEKIEETIRFINFHSSTNELKKLEDELKHVETNSLNNVDTKLQIKIENIKNEISELNKKEFKNDFEHHKKIIGFIGEPIIKYKLEAMLKSISINDEQRITNEQRILDLARELNIEVSIK